MSSLYLAQTFILIFSLVCYSNICNNPAKFPKRGGGAGPFLARSLQVKKHLMDLYTLLKIVKGSSRRGVADKPMSCKPGVDGSIPGFSQSVG